MPSCATLASSALRRCFMHLRHAHLSPGRLIDRCLHHRLFDLDRRAVLQHRLAPADLLQCQFAAFVVQLLEAIKAVSAIPHHLAGLAYIAELLGQLQQSDLCPYDLLLLCHFVISVPPKGGSRFQRQMRTAPRPPASVSKTNNDCRVKFELIQVIAELGDLSRFANARQLMAYLGLVPSEHSSG